VDSRGSPTLEVDVFVKNGFGRAIVPSGASTGSHEALELRDNKKGFFGKSVYRAVDNVKFLGKKLKSNYTQQSLDNELVKLDGTSNKSRFGANAILGISLAFAKAEADAKDMNLFESISKFSKSGIRLPIPAFNVINGGKHAGTKMAIQEFMLLPVKAKSFSSALQMGVEAYHELKLLLIKRFGKTAVNVGDEGGFASRFDSPEDVLDVLCDAVENAGYKGKILFGIDAAASEFYRRGKYNVDDRSFTPLKLLEYYVQLTKDFPLMSIEDPFEENDFDSFAELSQRIGKKVNIVGDDLLCTNPARIQKAIQKNSCNVLLMKPNQIGTLSESLFSTQLARSAGWGVMASHRSGDSEDSMLADISVGFGCEFLKSGAPCRSERLAKYNQLLRIEEILGKRARYG